MTRAQNFTKRVEYDEKMEFNKQNSWTFHFVRNGYQKIIVQVLEKVEGFGILEIFMGFVLIDDFPPKKEKKNQDFD